MASVTVDGSSAGAVTTYPFSNVTANHTISATFASNTYTITASAGANGKISPSGTVSVASGEQPGPSPLPPAPAIRWRKSRSTDLGRGGNELSFQQRNGQPYNLSDILNQHPQFIRASASANGSISPSGNVSVVSGAKQAFTITPAAHYQLADVLVDGEPIGAVSSGLDGMVEQETDMRGKLTLLRMWPPIIQFRPSSPDSSAGCGRRTGPGRKKRLYSDAERLQFDRCCQWNSFLQMDSGIRASGKTIKALGSDMYFYGPQHCGWKGACVQSEGHQ